MSERARSRAWQRMLSGRRLDLLDPSPLDIEIEDIAHGLARVARWNGQTLGELCRGLAMTRQAVAKHLTVLEQANLVSWKREGREKRHFINPVPIAAIAARWMMKFERPRLDALLSLKKDLEGEAE